MLKIDTQDLSVRYYENEYIYKLNCNKITTEIKRLKLSREQEITETIIIKNNKILVSKIIIENNKIEKVKLTKDQELDLINEILNSIKDNNMIRDLLAFDIIKSIIKENYLNILIDNNKLYLSSINYKDIIHKDDFEIDITSKYHKKIIGTIKVENNTLMIDVPDKYLKDSLILFYELICIYKKEPKNYDIKVLKLEGNTK